MATTSPGTAPDQSGWTQIDALTNSTVVSVQNRDLSQYMGIRIQTSAPSTEAWDADGSWRLDPGGAEMWGKAAGEHVYAKMEKATCSPKPTVQEKV